MYSRCQAKPIVRWSVCGHIVCGNCRRQLLSTSSVWNAQCRQNYAHVKQFFSLPFSFSFFFSKLPAAKLAAQPLRKAQLNHFIQGMYWRAVFVTRGISYRQGFHVFIIFTATSFTKKKAIVCYTGAKVTTSFHLTGAWQDTVYLLPAGNLCLD